MTDTSPKVQLPRLRKPLPTNQITIKYLLDSKKNKDSTSFINNLTIKQRFYNSKHKHFKSNMQSPKNIHSYGELDSKKFKKDPNKGFISFLNIDLDEKLSETRKKFDVDGSDSKIRYVTNYNSENISLSGNPEAKRGMTGYNVSKLYKSRNIIKYNPKFSYIDAKSFNSNHF
jgi:hypothetical protein